MMLRDKVQETISRARDLKHQTEDVLLTSLHTGLAAIQTICVLARQETGHKRTHHLQEAEKAFHAILDIAKRVRLSQHDGDAIEQAHRDILSLAAMTALKT